MEKFEIGDKVKLIRLDTKGRLYVTMMNEFLGQTMTVARCERCHGHLDVRLEEAHLWFNPEWLELVEKKKKGWTGQVVCTEVHDPCLNCFELGKVYDVKNGLLIDRTGTPYSDTVRYNSAVDLIQRFEKYNEYYRFIEFKGFNENKEETK